MRATHDSYLWKMKISHTCSVNVCGVMREFSVCLLYHFEACSDDKIKGNKDAKRDH